MYSATGNPIAAANTVFLLSFALSAFAAFCLAYGLTSAPWPSFLAGLPFGFAPFRFAQLSHVQLLNFFWCPLALLSLLTFLHTRRKAALALFGLFYCLQVLSSAYLAFMASIAVIVVVVVFSVAVDRRVWRWDMVRPALVCVAAMTAGDQRYSLLSTVHWRPIVNGRSGFVPPMHDDLRAGLATFPAPKALQYAAAIGLSTIVVHASHLAVDQRTRLRVAEEAGSVHRVATFGEDFAYGIGLLRRWPRPCASM